MEVNNVSLVKMTRILLPGLSLKKKCQKRKFYKLKKRQNDPYSLPGISLNSFLLIYLISYSPSWHIS